MLILEIMHLVIVLQINKVEKQKLLSSKDILFENIVRYQFNILVDEGVLYKQSQYCLIKLILPEKPVSGTVTHVGGELCFSKSSLKFKSPPDSVLSLSLSL